VVNGRAYFADGPPDRLIITAAHCLPFFPPCTSAAYLEEKTYKELLGPIGSEPTVWAECLFADIAILGPPDRQVLSDHAAEYEALVESATPLSIADAPEQGQGWMISLEGNWFRCGFQIINDGPLWISETEEPIEGACQARQSFRTTPSRLAWLHYQATAPELAKIPDLTHPTV
jgi:hypothetical protein